MSRIDRHLRRSLPAPPRRPRGTCARPSRARQRIPSEQREQYRGRIERDQHEGQRYDQRGCELEARVRADLEARVGKAADHQGTGDRRDDEGEAQARQSTDLVARDGPDECCHDGRGRGRRQALEIALVRDRSACIEARQANRRGDRIEERREPAEPAPGGAVLRDPRDAPLVADDRRRERRRRPCRTGCRTPCRTSSRCASSAQRGRRDRRTSSRRRSAIAARSKLPSIAATMA